MKNRIAVAMSGGVDSSVTALVLQDEGLEVIGLSMRLCPPCSDEVPRAAGRPGCSAEHVDEARRVADALGIDFHEIDLHAAFEDRVLRPFARAYAEGLTPNPCVTCNCEMKLGILARRGRELGCSLVATGHYAIVDEDPGGTGMRLRKGVDTEKDQSYFLFGLNQRQLRTLRLPAGFRTKAEMRHIARERGLPVAEKPESQEICFVAEDRRNAYGAVVESLHPGAVSPGEIVDRSGRVIGRHQGIHRYTVGQRRGLNLPSERPWYVVRLEPATSRVVVGREEDLYSLSLVAGRVSWISGSAPPLPLAVTARIRYRHPGSPAVVEAAGDHAVRVTFGSPQRAIAPGQAVVFYEGDTVLGGGWIERPPAAR